MHTTRVRPRELLAALLMLALAPAPVHAMAGSAALAGSTKLAVKHCGALRESITSTVTVRDDGTWSAGDLEGGVFSGTYVAVGKSGRKLALTFDAPTLAALTALVVEGVTIVCDATGVAITESRAKLLRLTLNRKLSKAKLVVRYVFQGTANGRSGTATYKAVGTGPWTPG